MTEFLSSKPKLKPTRSPQWERLLALAAVALIVVVWILGGIRATADLMPAIRQAMPNANHFKLQDDGVFAAYGDREEKNFLGFIAVGKANGYGGPLQLAVAVNSQGIITGLAVGSQKETPAWFDRVMKSGVLQSLIDKTWTERFLLGADVDSVTGATATVRAIAQAALDGSGQAARLLGLPVQETPSPEIQFGIPEFAVLALFIVGFIAQWQRFRFNRQARWGSMLAGMLLLGFVYNIPITIAFFIRLILGYWPPWQLSLYWYFLVGGIVFTVIISKKNPYCDWFCPFGAAQECIGAIGGAGIRTPRSYHKWLKWLQRGLALGAIMLGVFFRNPGLASYELFGTLFSFVGTGLQFLALGLVLITALYIRRPWCSYLCPVSPVVEWIRIMREWVIELWQRVLTRIRVA